MLSLKNFLNVSEEELAWRKAVFLLLEKIGSESVQGTNTEHAAFRAEISELMEHADEGASPALLSLTVGTAVQAMEIYNLRITELLRRQAVELQSIVAIITETARKIGGDTIRSAQRLQEIGGRFERAGAIEDLEALKGHLTDCLKSFREEAKRQYEESNAAVRSLQRGIEGGPNAVGDLDPVTGLRRRPAALIEMQSAAERAARLYIVTMVVRGVQAINSRFGFGAGDRMLRVFKESVERQLTRADKMFRWDGPAIVVLVEGTEPIAQVRAHFRRMLETRLEETFEVEDRSVMIPIAADTLTFSLMPPVTIAVKQIQAFIAGKASASAID